MDNRVKYVIVILFYTFVVMPAKAQYRERMAFLLDSNWQQYIDCTPLCSMDTTRYGAGGPHGVRRHYNKGGTLTSAFTYCNRQMEGPQFVFFEWNGEIASYFTRHIDREQGVSMIFGYGDKSIQISYFKLLDTVIRVKVPVPFDGIDYMELNRINDRFFKRFDKEGHLEYAVEVKDGNYNGLEVFLNYGHIDSVRLLNMGEVERRFTDAEIFAATDPSLPLIEESKKVKIEMPVLDFIEEPKGRKKPPASCEVCAKILGK